MAGSRLVHLRMPALTAASERSGWHDEHGAIGVLDEVVGHAAQERGLSSAASARSGDDRLGVDALCYREHGSRDASIALLDKRIGAHTGGAQAPRALLRRSLGPLEPLGFEVGGVRPPLVTQAKPRAQAKPELMSVSAYGSGTVSTVAGFSWKSRIT